MQYMRYMTNLLLEEKDFVLQAIANTKAPVEWRDYPMPVQEEDYEEDPIEWDDEGNAIAFSPPYSRYYPEQWVGTHGCVVATDPEQFDLSYFWREVDRLKSEAKSK